MHGRSWASLLAGILVAAPTLLGQSVEAKKSTSAVSLSRDPAGKSFAPESRSKPIPAYRAIAVAPVLTPSPALSMAPVPIPEPVPGRPPIFSPQSGLAQLVRAAGIIFSGTVISIERASAVIPGQAVGSVAVTFHVENAIRGATSGEDLTILQWIGLWSSGQRYQVGQRLLLFLYPPSRIGLTSCVGAAMGRFAVDSSNNVWLSPQQILEFRADPVLGRKSRVHLSDFVSAVQQAGPEE